MPLVFLVGNAVYYGPFVALVVLFWRPICRIANERGLGLFAFLGFGLFMSVTSESRHLTHLLPFIVALLAVELDRRGIGWREAAIVCVAQVACSKVWYPIESEPMKGFYIEFPWQRYFMSQGPFMSRSMYLLQGAVLTLVGVALCILFLRRRPAAENTARESFAAGAPGSR